MRQRDTAGAVLAELKVPDVGLGIDPRLDEYDHIGVLSAHTDTVSFETTKSDDDRRRLQSALDVALERWVAADLGGDVESHEQFVSRVAEAVAELTRLPGTTLAVTSGGVIAVAAAAHLGLPTDAWPHLARVTVNAALTKLVTGASGTSLVTFNDHAHLEADRGLITYR